MRADTYKKVNWHSCIKCYLECIATIYLHAKLVIHLVHLLKTYYNDAIMSAMASQITGVSIVCSIICSGADKRKTLKLPVTGLCEGNPPMRRGGFSSQRASNAKNFPFDDFIMNSWFRPLVRASNRDSLINPKSDHCLMCCIKCCVIKRSCYYKSCLQFIYFDVVFQMLAFVHVVRVLIFLLRASLGHWGLDFSSRPCNNTIVIWGKN